MEAEPKHGRQGDRGAHREDQIQREHIAQQAVDHRGQGRAAGGGRLDEAQDRAPVLLRQGQHHGGIEYGIADAVQAGRQEGEDTHRHEAAAQPGQDEKYHGAAEAQGHDPEPGHGLQLQDAQEQDTQQRAHGVYAHDIAVHIHREALLHAEGEGQGQGAGAQQIHDQGRGHEDPQALIGEDRLHGGAHIPQKPADGYLLPLLHRPRHPDEELGKSGIEVAQAVDHHDQRHAEEGHHDAAEGGAHGLDQAHGPGEDRLAPYHIIMGDDVDHEGIHRGAVENAAQGRQERRQQHPRDAQPVRIGQDAHGQHEKSLEDIHAHHDPLPVQLIHDAAGEGREEHGHEHGDRFFHFSLCQELRFR